MSQKQLHDVSMAFFGCPQRSRRTVGCWKILVSGRTLQRLHTLKGCGAGGLRGYTRDWFRAIRTHSVSRPSLLLEGS